MAQRGQVPEDTVTIFRARRTILQMLRDRRYTVEDSDLSMSLDGFLEKFGEMVNRDDLTIKASQSDEPSVQIYVFFSPEPKLGVKSIRVYVEKMRTENVARGVIVVKQKLTPASKKLVLDFNSKYQMEVFLEEELVVNITEHELVPKHEVLTNEEKWKLLQHYKVKETQLPRMLITDPVARYYGMRRGQVARITRDSETAGKYITYRCVV